MDKSSLLDRGEETSVSSIHSERSLGQSTESGEKKIDTTTRRDGNGSLLSRILPNQGLGASFRGTPGTEEIPSGEASSARAPQDSTRAYLTLVPSISVQDPHTHYTIRNNIRKKNMRRTLLYMLLVAIAVASAVFVMVPRSLSIGQVVVVPDAMTWDTSTSSYNVRLNVTIPIENPNFVPYHVHGQLEVLFYDALAGKTVIQETMIPWRSFPDSIRLQMDASSVPKKYILSILSQCSTFPHVLTFFLQGNLYGSVLPEAALDLQKLVKTEYSACVVVYVLVSFTILEESRCMSTSIRTAAGQQQQHTFGPVDTIDMFPLMNCGESADLGELLDGPSGMNGDKGLSHRFPAWGDVSLSDAADIGQPPYSGNISGGSIPLGHPPMMNFTTNNGYSRVPPPMQECQQFIPNGPIAYQMKQQQQQQQQPEQAYWNFPPVQQQQPGIKVVGANGMAYPIWWQNVNGTLVPYFATLPIYNGPPPSSDSDSGQATQFVASSEPLSRRQACVERYRKKKAKRSFKKHIRYQMRKDNADKRRRVKGRFVRSTDQDPQAKDPVS